MTLSNYNFGLSHAVSFITESSDKTIEQQNATLSVFISKYVLSGKVHIQRFFQVKIVTGTQPKILHVGLPVASELYIALNPTEQLH
jgi:hypothetical protein